MVSLMSVNVYAGSGGDYWPTWRGPDGTGAAGKGNPPVTWSETENIKWKVDVPGESLSSPIIWENKIFFQTAIKTDKKGEVKKDDSAQQNQSGGRRRRGSPPPTNIYKFDIVCMDRGDGKILWQKTACEELPHEGAHDTASLANYSPVTDGKYVWASFGSWGVHCYDLDGNRKWSRNDLGKMKMRGTFGEGSSPALAGDALIVVMDQEEDSFIYALNKETGETIWKKARDEGTTWASPLAVEVDGKIQVITNAINFVRSYDARTGDVIWQCSGQTQSVIPTPVSGFGMVFCMSGYRGSAMQAIKLGRTGDLSGTDAIAWEMSDGTAYVSSQLLLGDKLFFCADSKNAGLVSCYDAKTGKAYYMKQRLDGVDTIYSSFVGVGDRVYVAARNGTVVVLKNSDQFEVLATNKLDDGFDATPAIVGDELYLKGKEHFYCIAKP
jgi:outer membrane protein assembly factor BamB